MTEATLAVDGDYLLLLDEGGKEISRVLGGHDGEGFYRFGEPLDIPDGITIANERPL